MRLLRLIKLSGDRHKYEAVFDVDGHEKSTKFGFSGMDDYTLTHDKEQRDRYRLRHEKDLKTNDPTRAGYLSYYLLWGESVSIRRNLADYKKKFGL